MISYTEIFDLNQQISDLALSPQTDARLRDALGGPHCNEIRSVIETTITRLIRHYGVDTDTGEWLGDWSAEDVVRGVLTSHVVTVYSDTDEIIMTTSATTGVERIRAAATALSAAKLLGGRAAWSLGDLMQAADDMPASTAEYLLMAVEEGMRHWRLTAPGLAASDAARELRAAYDAWAATTAPESEWLTCETCGVTGPQVAETADPGNELLDPGEERETITVCGRCLLQHEYDI